MKKFIAILISMLCALGSLSFVGCGQKKGGTNTLQVWINKAGYGVDWVEDAFNIFKEEEWVKERYPDGIKLTTSNFGGATTGLDHLVGGGTQYDLVMPTAGLSSGTYLENYKMFEDLTSLYEDRVIPSEEVTILEKMIPEIANETSLSIRTLDDPIRVAIPWINGAHGWFYNETTLKEYVPGITYETMPRTTNEFIDLLDDIKAAIAKSGKQDWAIFHHTAAVSYWTSDATTWWAQYDGIDGYNRYFEGKNEQGATDEVAAAKNSESAGRLEALKVLDEIINYSNGYVYGKHHEELAGYNLVLGRLAEGSQFVFSSNGDWIENETNPYKGENEVIRMMKTPVISAIVNKLSFAGSSNAERVLSEMIRCIDEELGFEPTRMAVIQITKDQITQDDYDIVKNARNTVSRVGGHVMCIPSYADAKELAKDFLLFLASDKGIESMMRNGIYSSYEYDYSAKDEIKNGLSQMRQDFIDIMDDARACNTLMRNPESFPTVYYGGLKAWHTHQHPHIGAVFVAPSANSRKTPTELFNLCKVSQATFSGILKSSGL